MKYDEAVFLHLVATKSAGATVRDVINSDACTVNYKRCWYYLEKWTRKGWYNYGVSLDMGWLEPAGRQAALKARADIAGLRRDCNAKIRCERDALGVLLRAIIHADVITGWHSD